MRNFRFFLTIIHSDSDIHRTLIFQTSLSRILAQLCHPYVCIQASQLQAPFCTSSLRSILQYCTNAQVHKKTISASRLSTEGSRVR